MTALPIELDNNICIRAANDEDSEAVINLISSVYSEYEGCVLDVEKEEKDLRTPASSFAQLGGAFWVAERDGEIIGSGAVMPTDAPGVARLHKLYVAKSARGTGLGSQLLKLAESTAKNLGADKFMLYTDTRFHDAQKLYENKGYTKQSGTRHLADASNSIEFTYTKAI